MPCLFWLHSLLCPLEIPYLYDQQCTPLYHHQGKVTYPWACTFEQLFNGSAALSHIFLLRALNSLQMNLLSPTRVLLGIARVVLLVDNFSSWITSRYMTPLSATADKDRFSMYPYMWSNVLSVYVSVLGVRRVAVLELPPAKGPPAPYAWIWCSCCLSASI